MKSKGPRGAEIEVTTEMVRGEEENGGWGNENFMCTSGCP